MLGKRTLYQLSSTSPSHTLFFVKKAQQIQTGGEVVVQLGTRTHDSWHVSLLQPAFTRGFLLLMDLRSNVEQQKPSMCQPFPGPEWPSSLP